MTDEEDKIFGMHIYLKMSSYRNIKNHVLNTLKIKSISQGHMEGTFIKIE